MTEIVGGRTINDYNLKGGVGEVFIRNIPESVGYDDNTYLLDAELAWDDTSFTHTTGQIKDGDIFCIIRTGEKFFVSDVTVGATDTITIVRGIDGTSEINATMFDAPEGSAIKRIGFGWQVVSSLGDDSPYIDCQTTGNPDDSQYDLSKEYVLRREKDKGEERMLLLDDDYDDGGGADPGHLVVKRNINLLIRDTTSIATGDILIAARQKFYEPSLLAYRTAYWYQMEVKDSIMITPNFDAVQTDSSLRTGPNFANHIRWTVNFNSAVVDPGIWKILFQDINNGYSITPSPAITNKPDQQEQGISLNSDFFGKQVSGIMIYIRGKETNRPFEALIYYAAMSSPGEIPLGQDQRIVDMTYDSVYMPCMGSNGVIRQADACFNC